MKRALFLAVAALCALARPATVYAQSDFIDWLESLSGPGPFHGYFTSVGSRVFCTMDDGSGQMIKWWCADDSSPKVKNVVAVDFAWSTSGDHTRFSDATAEAQNTLPVHASRILANYYYRFHPMVDLGVGAGVIVFSGDDFSKQVHPILSPLTLSFTPFGFLHGEQSIRWGRVLKLEFSERYILGDIRAADFGSSLSTYLKQGEFNSNFSVAVDFWPVLFKNH
ncbi:MAG TPA: hypothetical protein VLV86_19475 [Vicinamibacterales bacterium]|nr:hypothetical protein [Vicinamibacterales bacterium]